MFNWAQKQLANVAGTAEPIYGPEAIQSVEKQAHDTPYTELTKDDMKWETMGHTSVESQVFYFVADSGHLGMAQIIYSSPTEIAAYRGIHTTVQFNSKIWYMDGRTPNLWSSDPLEHHRISEDRHSLHADNCDLVLSEDGNSYSIKSSTNKQCIVDVKVTRTAPGVVIGKNGTSFFGTDPANPWGKMRHRFWPRCKVEGSFLTKTGEIDFKGLGSFNHALQGMKPHHAAARWNFVSFQAPTYSAIMMDFITPPSYGSTVVNVGIIATDDGIVLANASGKAAHTEIKPDPENKWPEPTATKYDWTGKSSDGKDVSAELVGPLVPKLDRVDIMAEVPRFVKQIVAASAGTKPYIYQYGPKMTLKLRVGDEVKEEEGRLFTEATFIS
ncbi:oxidative stress survival, Svf1-like protein [Aulographum hederae CBS 113979]|uniref:Oxidative stress survival, Svf1-like protein n=1 Tax=Aulographum hederae CBS 113979 TaxID=1176131 RepID=A0A6G1HC07_9PEZI|nr:oxidative stress survival, Svf1-like protein [Aulographum hederae CBS 113979]